MTRHAPTLLLTAVAAFAGCRQLPPPTPDSDSRQARYVAATTLTSGDEYAGVQVITAVPLRHITAVDAEARLRGQLPEGVTVGRTGQAKKLLLQGPGQAVVAAMKVLTELDVR